jgi:hypothetical protein
MYVNYFISALHHVAGQDPEALVVRLLVGVLQVPTEDGTTCHSMIIMEEAIGGLIEIMQGITGGGGTHFFLSPFSFLQEVRI